jgi:DNA modification methylase
MALQADGWVVRSEIAWVRTTAFEWAQKRPAQVRQSVLMLTKTASDYHWRGGVVLRAVSRPNQTKQRRHRDMRRFQAIGRQLPNVWYLPHETRASGHPAPFPFELAEICIALTCPPDGHVLDPFGGSGSTAIAAKRLGRSCTSIELIPKLNELT